MHFGFHFKVGYNFKILNETSIKVGVFINYINLEFLINNLIVLGKHFIHRCKYLKVKPHFTRWRNDLKLFVKSFHWIIDRNALKLLSALHLCI